MNAKKQKVDEFHKTLLFTHISLLLFLRFCVIRNFMQLEKASIS